MKLEKNAIGEMMLPLTLVVAVIGGTVFAGCQDKYIREADTHTYNPDLNVPEDDDHDNTTVIVTDPDDDDETTPFEPDEPADVEAPEPPPGIRYDPERSNNMLVIDRSGSMAEPSDCGEYDCPSKWDQLLALRGYLTEVKMVANLGLTLFPSPVNQGCSVEPSVMVPITESQDVDGRIMDALLETVPGGRTPIAAVLDALGDSGELDDPEVDTNVIILTDGQPNCVCESGDVACERDAAVASVERLTHQYPELDVYVIGFGSSAHEAHETLTAMANVGGNNFYQADTIEDLIGKLYEVAIENVSCTFYLDEWPDAEQLLVWMDDQQVPACEEVPCEAGYLYEPEIGVVELQGASCDDLRDGERHMVWFDEA